MSVDDLIRGFKALDAVRDQYLRNWTYYAGNLPERFASERIEQLVKSSADTTYRFRFARKSVTTLKNRVKLAGVTGRSEEITRKLDEIRAANSMDMLEPFLIERTFVYGDAYALTWPLPEPPEDPDEPDPVAPDLREAGCEITYQSPLSCRAIYDAEDGLRLEFTIRRWKVKNEVGEEQWHAELWYPEGVIEPWVCLPGTDGTDPESWTAEEVQEHEFGMPIHHARNDLPHGRSELADAMGPQDALTKLILTQAVVDLEAHGWRERWELVDEKAALDAARDAVPWDDDTQAPTVEQAKRTSGRKGGPGTTHILEGRKSTGEYSAPNPAELTPVSDQWLKMMSTVTDTPAHEYDPERAAGLTGIARMWADKPLAAREDNAKRFLVRFFLELYGKALEIAGMPNAGVLTLTWGRPDVVMDPDWWEVATIRRDHGVPQEQILREANYDPDDIEKWLKDEGAARSLLEKITLIEKLGTALQTLGSAVALGAIDQARVDTLTTRILGTDVIEDEPAEPPRPALPGPVIVPGPREVAQ